MYVCLCVQACVYILYKLFESKTNTLRVYLIIRVTERHEEVRGGNPHTHKVGPVRGNINSVQRSITHTCIHAQLVAKCFVIQLAANLWRTFMWQQQKQQLPLQLTQISGSNNNTKYIGLVMLCDKKIKVNCVKGLAWQPVTTTITTTNNSIHNCTN